MRSILERILGVEAPPLHGSASIVPSPQLAGDDHAIVVNELTLEMYILELCHLIAKESKGSKLRQSYEAILNNINRIYQASARSDLALLAD